MDKRFDASIPDDLEAKTGGQVLNFPGSENCPRAMRLGPRAFSGGCADMGKPHQNTPYPRRRPPKNQETPGLAIKHTRVGQVGSPQPLAAFESSHRSTDGGVVYAESIGNLLYGVDTGLKGPGHGLAPVGVAARETGARPRFSAPASPDRHASSPPAAQCTRLCAASTGRRSSSPKPTSACSSLPCLATKRQYRHHKNLAARPWWLAAQRI
jgi:hypothetical protein